jgi:hypothetical protein
MARIITIGGKNYRVTNPPRVRKTKPKPDFITGKDGKTYRVVTGKTTTLPPQKTSNIRPSQVVPSGRFDAKGNQIYVPFRQTRAYLESQPTRLNPVQQRFVSQANLSPGEVKTIIKNQGMNFFNTLARRSQLREQGFYDAKQQRFIQEMTRRASTPQEARALLRAVTRPSKALQAKADRDVQISNTRQRQRNLVADQVFSDLNASTQRVVNRNMARLDLMTGRNLTNMLRNIEKPKQMFFVTEIKKPNARLDRLLYNLKLRESIALTDIQITQDPLKRIGTGIVVLGVIGGLKGLVGVAKTIRNPIQTAKNIVSAVRQPVKTFIAVGEQFQVNPVGTIAEFFVYSKGLSLVGKAGKNSAVGKYVREEMFIRAQPIEIRPYVRSIIKSSKVQSKLYPTKIKNIKKVSFYDVKELNKMEAVALKKALQSTDSVVFGSKAAKVTAGKSRLPKPKDVDLATSNPAVFNRIFKQNIPRKFRSNYVIRGEKILVKRGNQLVPILDVKPLTRLIPNRSIITKRGSLPVSGYVKQIGVNKRSILPTIKKKAVTEATTVPTQKLVKIDGIKFTGFGEQTIRKALGTLDVLIKKNVKRAKDPQSLVISLQTQLEALKRVTPKTGIKALLNKRKIRTLDNAIIMLTSKKFKLLLERKVPGIMKEYPIFRKISIPKLKKVKRLPVAQIRKKLGLKPKTPVKKLPAKKLPKKVRKTIKRTTSKLRGVKRKVSSKLSSKLASSKLKASRLRASKVPSKLPSRTPSRLKTTSKTPSKLPSRLRRVTPSKIPSRLRSRSKLPSKLRSRVPSKLKTSSTTPSKLPGRTSSKLRSRLPSRLRGRSRLPRTTKLPVPKLPQKAIQWTKKQLTKRYKKFDVYLKKRGAKRPYMRANSGWMTFNDAKNLGRYVSDNTPLASYQIRPSKLIGKRQKFKATAPDKKFRRVKAKSKLPRKTVVERRKYRMDTVGEKRGISIKGLRRLRNQKNILNLIKGKKPKKIKRIIKRRRRKRAKRGRKR